MEATLRLRDSRRARRARDWARLEVRFGAGSRTFPMKDTWCAGVEGGGRWGRSGCRGCCLRRRMRSIGGGGDVEWRGVRSGWRGCARGHDAGGCGGARGHGAGGCGGARGHAVAEDCVRVCGAADDCARGHAAGGGGFAIAALEDEVR